MKTRSTLAAVCAVAFVITFALTRSESADAPKPASEFSKTTIDLGIVVADVEKSAKFYTEALGFQEVPGFAVPGEFCADAGLTDGHALAVRLFVLGQGEAATRIKLMQIPDAKPKKNENAFISSQLGFRYLTIYVSDTTVAVERLKKAGAAPIAKTPLGIPNNTFLTCVRDPDGNLIELIGPKK